MYKSWAGPAPQGDIFMEKKIWFGLVLGRFAILKKKLRADYEQLLRSFFSCFHSQKMGWNIFQNTLASALNSWIKRRSLPKSFLNWDLSVPRRCWPISFSLQQVKSHILATNFPYNSYFSTASLSSPAGVRFDNYLIQKQPEISRNFSFHALPPSFHWLDHQRYMRLTLSDHHSLAESRNQWARGLLLSGHAGSG